MKTAKRFLAGTTLFILGIVFTLGVVANTRHHNFSHNSGIRKSAIIEVGAPLTVSQMKHLGLTGITKSAIIEVGAPLTVQQLKTLGLI